MDDLSRPTFWWKSITFCTAGQPIFYIKDPLYTVFKKSSEKSHWKMKWIIRGKMKIQTFGIFLEITKK